MIFPQLESCFKILDCTVFFRSSFSFSFFRIITFYGRRGDSEVIRSYYCKVASESESERERERRGAGRDFSKGFTVFSSCFTTVVSFLTETCFAPFSCFVMLNQNKCVCEYESYQNYFNCPIDLVRSIQCFFIFYIAPFVS